MMKATAHVASAPLLLLLLMAASVRGDWYKDQIEKAPEGRLNSYQGDDEKFVALGPDQISDVASYEDAQRACHGTRTHGMLAAAWEWCLYPKADNPEDRGIHGGVRDTEQWVPVRHWANNFNNWLLIGPLGGTDSSKVCQYYHDIYPEGYGATDWPDPEEVTLAEESENLCFMPTDCNGDKCAFDCSLRPKGYYPSGEDCHSYCYCPGDGTDGYWENIKEEGKAWDPWCRDSTALDSSNVPLGGMTGGCKND